MSMDDLVRDMRNRFLVTALLPIPLTLYSPIGRKVLGFTTAGAVRPARRRGCADSLPVGDLLLTRGADHSE
jgi:hypothetical protein